MTNDLIEFLTELSTNDNLMLDFIKDRETTMKKYGLSEEEIRIVIEEDYQTLNKSLPDGTKTSTHHIIKIIKP